MINKKTRKEITTSKRIIASELSKLQQGIFDEEDMLYYESQCEANLYREQFDCIDESIVDYQMYHKVISIQHNEIETFAKELAPKLVELFRIVGSQDLIVLSHLKLDFFGKRTNPNMYLKKAYSLLEELLGTTSYKEAIEINLSDIPNIIHILFWLTRYDPSSPEYIFLFDKEELIHIQLCKYGNIHLCEYTKERLTSEKLTELGWTIREGEEFDNFNAEA